MLPPGDLSKPVYMVYSTRTVVMSDAQDLDYLLQRSCGSGYLSTGPHVRGGIEAPVSTGKSTRLLAIK